MTLVTMQIFSNILVPLISFAAGYFLFKLQSKESMTLEVFRRRLDSYELISTFVQKVDSFAHKQMTSSSLESEARERTKQKLVQECFDLTYTRQQYISSELAQILESFSEQIYGLDDSLPELEENVVEINQFIYKDIEKYLSNPKSEPKFSNNEERSTK